VKRDLPAHHGEKRPPPGIKKSRDLLPASRGAETSSRHAAEEQGRVLYPAGGVLGTIHHPWVPSPRTSLGTPPSSRPQLSLPVIAGTLLDPS